MDEVKQQIVDKLQNANNILVTVSANPTVDQLSACIALTILLNKMNKHATAVFSGKVPSTIEFLKPEETLEANTDSLRDFIISLDKDKADKLRYKVEDEVVKIFITPYKASLSEKDLVFGQGDFNVDVIIALGVHQAQDLDNAITAHGRILHDAVVICVNTASNGGELGSLNWLDGGASGMSEMVTTLATNLGQNLLDGQIATALLTGIVAQTDHFSNAKTSPTTMTASAALLAAGANQQLVAKELATPKPAVPATAPKAAAPEAAPAKEEDGELDVPHEPDAESDAKPSKELNSEPAAKDESDPLKEPMPPFKPADEPTGMAKPKAGAKAPKSDTPSANPSDKLAQRMKRIEPLPHDSATPAETTIRPTETPAANLPKPLGVLDEKSDDSLDELLKHPDSALPPLSPLTAPEKTAPKKPESTAEAEPKPGATSNTAIADNPEDKPEPHDAEKNPSAPVIEVPPAPETADELINSTPVPPKTEDILTPLTMPAPAPIVPPAPAASEGSAPVPAEGEGDNEKPGLALQSAEEVAKMEQERARKAVEDALKAAPDQPEPLAALGAINVDLPLGHEAAQPAAPDVQPGPGMPPAAPGLTPGLGDPGSHAAADNMPQFEDLPSTPSPNGPMTLPPAPFGPPGPQVPPQPVFPGSTPGQLPPMGPPPPPVPPPMP